MLYFALWFSSHPSVIMCHHQPLFTVFHLVKAISKIITHRSEVVPEYEPGGARSKADTADSKVEQTHSKEACTSGDTKHQDQGVFFLSLNLEHQGDHSQDYLVQLKGREERGGPALVSGVNREHFQSLPFFGTKHLPQCCQILIFAQMLFGKLYRLRVLGF